MSDLCFITRTDLFDAVEDVKNQGVTIMEEPVKRTGAQAGAQCAITSFYFRDPDGNLIEISTYLNT